MTQLILKNIFYLLIYGLVLLLVLVSLNHSFFWDTIHYTSVIPNFYYTTHFSSMLPPDSIDSGEIPLYGMYIALIWNLFGENLAVSHLALLPFAFGIVWQLQVLCRHFIEPKYHKILLVMLLVDSALLTQFTLASPEIPLLFSFLLGLNAIFKNRKWQLALSLFLLFAIHTRGQMLALCLLVFDVYYTFSWKRTSLLSALRKLSNRFLLYLPALLVFIVYNSYHFIEKGWIISNENGPWRGTKQLVNGNEFLFNVGILGWRFLDFGRIIIWFILFGLLITFKNKIRTTTKTKQLLLLFVSILLFLHFDMLFAKNLLAPRYFIPINIVISLFTGSLLFASSLKEKNKYILASIWIVCLLASNLIIYPPKLAKGWDVTLAHLPLYELRHQAIAFLDAQHIDCKEVDTFFPNTATFDRIDLNQDLRNFGNYSPKSNYVFYSNVFNMDDAVYDDLHNIKKYKAIKQFEKNRIYITIFKKIN